MLARAAYTGRQVPSGLSTMSRNFKLFLGAAVTFYLAGSMNQAAELFVLAGVCLACILGCYIISRLGVEGLLLRVRPRSGPVWAGKDVEASIELSNIGLIARPPVSVRVELRNATVDAPLEPYLFPLPGLAPGQAVTTTGTVVPACRGEYLLLEPPGPTGGVERLRGTPGPRAYLPQRHGQDALGADAPADGRQAPADGRVLRNPPA